MSQQGLCPRLKHKDFLKAVTRMVGIQAQAMSAAELAIGTRVDGLSPQHVRTALWQDHTLVKTLSPLTTAIRKDIEAEVDRLEKFHNSKVALEYADPL